MDERRVTPVPPPAADQSLPGSYEPPVLHEIGPVYDLTLTGGSRCWWGKKWGGTDGLEFMGITVPVSSC
jgi:hypothetical protein